MPIITSSSCVDLLLRELYLVIGPFWIIYPLRGIGKVNAVYDIYNVLCEGQMVFPLQNIRSGSTVAPPTIQGKSFYPSFKPSHLSMHQTIGNRL